MLHIKCMILFLLNHKKTVPTMARQRAGFRAEDLKKMGLGPGPGCAPGSETRRKPRYKLCFLTF